jgi:hypothetical protein
LTVQEAQAGLLNIIEMTQDGILTPAEAVQELTNLKELSEGSGFETNYTLGDFILIRENALSTYDDAAYYVDDFLDLMSLHQIDEEER